MPPDRWAGQRDDFCTITGIDPAEEYLEYLRVQRMSPNTVKSYAHALALWWEYLAAFELDWDRVSLEDFGGFLTWLRTGADPEVIELRPVEARFAESTIAVRLRAVLSCYTYHQLNGVDVGRDLYRITHGRAGTYKPLLEHIARRLHSRCRGGLLGRNRRLAIRFLKLPRMPPAQSSSLSPAAKTCAATMNRTGSTP